MNVKKFEWFTIEDTMADALAYNLRMLTFLKQINICYHHLSLSIEIVSLGYSKDKQSCDNSFDGHGYVYIDESDAETLELRFREMQTKINPDYPNIINASIRWGHFTDIEKETWNDNIDYFVNGTDINGYMHFQPSMDDVPLRLFEERGIHHFVSQNGSQVYSVMDVLINENDQYVHKKTNEMLEPVKNAK